eukprot:TRINITY_DN1496_c0_g1_i7.p1 TRINITY_DN1496_c0_g1~~TRINITY_DN1496_c0_g1_i7.p1  ORF type:complete len:277 (+),score=24.13 TRINITY_DN1496_c0_g1_i7:25-855(+)
MGTYRNPGINHSKPIIKRPSGIRTIGSKWVFRTKTDISGQPIRFKARICAKGFKQRKGIDYFETSSPVVNIYTLRILLAIAAFLKYKVYQLDVVQAYLNSDLDVDIFMELPPGIEGDKNDVMHLKKSLYGLKQSGRNWNIDLTNWLTSNGLERCPHEECLFANKDRTVIVAIYVDNLIIATKNEELARKIHKDINKTYETTDLELATHVIGIEIRQEKDRIAATQEHKIRKMLEDFNMTDANPKDTPIDAKISPDLTNPFKDQKKGLKIFKRNNQL